MKKLYHTFLLLILSVSLFQCRKEPAYTGAPDPTPVIITPDPVTTSLRGYIVDENGMPAAGAAVTAGNKTTLTDAGGNFRIDNAVLDKKNTQVTVNKEGYFKGMRLLGATAGCNFIRIKLVKKLLAGTIASSSGGTVELGNGSKISLPAGSVVIASSGEGFNGNVNVYAQYIDPSADDIAMTVPGSFTGYDKNAKRVILSSYGMLAVELENTGGEKLQIKDGYTATLTMPVPAGAQASAPASVPLWYIDEKTGTWREEGTAAKQGNTYSGTVKHFSFWNADIASASVDISMTLVNENNSPIAYAAVRVSHPASPWITPGYAYTDSLGHLSGTVPANEALLLEVLEPCNNTVAFSYTIAALQQNQDLGNISIALNASVATLKGRLLNCSNQPVTNGYAAITHGSTTFYAATNGNGQYEVTFVMCSSASPLPAVTISGTDNSNPSIQVTPVTVNLFNATTAPDIAVCNTAGFIHYNIDGVDYAFAERNDGNEDVSARVGDAGQGPIVMIYGSSLSPDRIMNMNMGGTTAGTYPVTLANSFYATEAFPFTGQYTVNFESGSTSTLSVIANNNGEYYEGSMTCRYTTSVDNFAAVHTMNCTFRAKRVN